MPTTCCALVASAFGLRTKDVDKSDLLLALEAFLVSLCQQGKRALLIVDEAQNLTPRAVEELRMLSNFQLETQALLQSFLVGQPEFRRTMQSPQMQQLRQRVIAAYHIGPMDIDETRGYVEHRLRYVGWKGDPQLPARARSRRSSVPREAFRGGSMRYATGCCCRATSPASGSSRATTSRWSRARCTMKPSTSS